MNAAELYWITRLDAICGTCVVLFTLGFVAAILTAVLIATDAMSSTATSIVKKIFKTTCIILPITLLICIFLPSTKQMVAIKVIPCIASPENCEKLKAANSKLLDKAVEWLELKSKSK